MAHRLYTARSEIAFWSVWLGLVGLFVALCAWVDRSYALPLDKRITFGVQELYRYAWADDLFDAVNWLGNEDRIVVVLLGLFAALLIRGYRYEALMVAGAGAVRYIQLAVRATVERPSQEFDELRAVFGGLFHPEIYPSPDGFPSGHVFGEAIVYGLLFAYAGRLLRFTPLVILVRAFCVLEIALGGVARMYIGAHWFSDVVGSLMLAAIYLLLAWRIDKLIWHLRSNDELARELQSPGRVSHSG